jgi:hypothetical protein
MNQARVVLLRHLVASRAQDSHVNRELTSQPRASPRLARRPGAELRLLGAQPKSFRVETSIKPGAELSSQPLARAEIRFVFGEQVGEQTGRFLRFSVVSRCTQMYATD